MRKAEQSSNSQQSGTPRSALRARFWTSSPIKLSWDKARMRFTRPSHNHSIQWERTKTESVESPPLVKAADSTKSVESVHLVKGADWTESVKSATLVKWADSTLSVRSDPLVKGADSTESFCLRKWVSLPKFSSCERIIFFCNQVTNYCRDFLFLPPPIRPS